METIKSSPLIINLAEWAWSSDPSLAVSPQLCLSSLSTPCLLRLIARGTGICIIFLSLINKAPVISNMMKSRSAAGISVTSACGEVIMYSNTTFYNLLRGNPFTSYGETMSLVIQTLIIVGLIFWFRRDGMNKIGMHLMILALVVYLFYLFVVCRVMTPDTQYILMISNPAVLLISRGSQIVENYKQKQTGAQSIATTGTNLVRTLIQTGTTIKEVGWDFHILRSYCASLALNSMLAIQLIIYKKNAKKFFNSLKEKKLG